MTRLEETDRGLGELLDGFSEAVRRIGSAHFATGSAEGFPQDAWLALAGTGMFMLPFSEDEGGMDVSLPGVLKFFEALGREIPDNGFTFLACTHLCALCMPLARFGSDGAKAEFLTRAMTGELIGAHAISEPGAGSAAFDMKTRAVPVDGGWQITGEKCFVSNGPFADVVVIYACTDPEAGPLNGYSAFLMPSASPGVSRGRATPKIGLKTSPFGPIYLDGVFVPDEMVLGAPGLGYAVLDHVMKREVLITFIAHLGQMSRRFDGTRDYVRGRNQGGRRLSQYQSVANRVVDGFIRLETARMWLYHAAEVLQHGQNGTREVSIAKLLCSEANLDNALDAVRLRGASGYLEEAGLGHEVTDALGSVIYSGSSEIQRNRIAATLGL